MRTRTHLAALALLVASISVGGAVIWQAERIWATEQRDGARHVAAGAAFALEQQVSRSLSATYSLAVLVHQDPRMADFERLAAGMLPIHGAVSSLQLAPGGVIRRIHPLAGNERAIGHDLFADPSRRPEALAAVESRRLTVAGPFALVQGGHGLVGRLPVFLPDRAAPGGERFWGLVIALVHVPGLLEAAQLHRVEEEGFRYRLTRHGPERRQVECFAGCEAPVAEPVTFEVQVPNGAWTLAVAPAEGWTAPPWRAVAWLLVLAASCGIALLALQVLRQPALLRREVAARTAELRRANAALAEEMERVRVAEERLRQSQKMEAIGQLAGGIAHDFNNLLTGILGWASVLLEENAPGSPTAEAAGTIAGAAQRASELTRQLLGFARRRPLQAVPFDAHGVLDEVARLLARTLDARLRFERRLAAPRAVVIGDPCQLQQALLNLAVNARDAMPDGGELRLESAIVERDERWSARHPSAATGPHLAITVADTGHGVPPELHERIFEPFFTTKAPGGGTGLGLAMVYGIARAHGGAVELESEPGRGARFTLSIPLAPPGVAPAAAPAGAAPERRVAGGAVLVVDDDPIPRGATSAMLGCLGYEPVEAESAQDGLRWLAAHPGAAHAVLLDVAMPGMDGVAAFEALRRVEPAVRVVFVSGYARNERARELAARGEATFLGKPFDREQLAAALDAAPPGRRCP
jgi:signal transduction histidine kinase/ActR/RegA family two-component response regulator